MSLFTNPFPNGTKRAWLFNFNEAYVRYLNEGEPEIAEQYAAIHSDLKNGYISIAEAKRKAWLID